jgi:squalene-associated FAD-dependent desaturase
MPPTKAYVVGAGLSGLSAGLSLSGAGVPVELIEAAPQAGGRCRSYFDSALDQTIDNGNHFVLTGNHATMAYLDMIGARGGLTGPDKARTTFMDLDTGKRWTIAPDDGPIPYWLFDPARRVPGTSAGDYLALVRLLAAGRSQTLGEVLPSRGALWERLLRPFFLGALNTEPEISSARLASQLVRETFAKGGNAYRTRIAHPTLGAVFVDPALQFLGTRNATVRFGERLRTIERSDTLVTALETAERRIVVTPSDIVVLATPPWVTAEMLPGTPAPDSFSAIVNGHFKRPGPPDAPGMLGLLGGTAEWVFSFPDRISVTVSGADWLVDRPREELAATLWGDVAKALGLEAELPVWQIVKEKRATFAATPEQNAKRPQAGTRWRNLLLAGDWTDTRLPATIEGAIRSGRKAAELALKGRAG